MTYNNNLASFGELLKNFRTERNLTQQQLARELGVHRHAIGRWEQGDNLPASKAIVLELAKHLHLDIAGTRQFLEASLVAPLPHWLVPLPRNPFFTGREDILNVVHTRLNAHQTAAITHAVALPGLGGVGKTQLALEYAYRHGMEYSAVFWIGAETEEQVVSSFVRIAEVLAVPGRDEHDPQRVVVAVQRWLARHEHWLLIWDNVDDLDLLARYLPASRFGATLITTRCQSLGTLASGVTLPPMEPEEGMLFLLRRAKIVDQDAPQVYLREFGTSQPDEYIAANDLVAALGGLPLALDQAGAYIEETRCRLADYLHAFEQQRVQFLARRGTPGTTHPDSVATTFTLIWQRMQQEQPLAADVLRVCAFLQADAIPEEILLASIAERAPIATTLDLALAVLQRNSLLQRNSAARTVSLHRLVQVVLQESMSEPERAAFRLRVIHLLNAIFPDVLRIMRVETWDQCERLLPHVLTCAAAIQEYHQDLDLAEVLLKIASYLQHRSQNLLAERLGQRALSLFMEILGSHHSQVAIAQFTLADIANDQGHYAQAEQLYQQAIWLMEQTFDLGQPEVALALIGLANVYKKQGHFAQAEPLLLRALDLREQDVGPDHLEVGVPLNNLSILYREMGRYEQAEQLFRRVLHIREQALGPEHPQVASILNNLADLYCKLGRHKEAEPLSQRALSLFEQALDPEDPDIAFLLDTLATIYREQGKYEQAKPLYERTLRLFENGFGSEHPLVVFPLGGLASIAGAEGEYAAAQVMYERALQIQQQTFGLEHPETARILADLAKLYERWDRYEQAESHLRQACSIFAACLGQTHPEAMKATYDHQCLLERMKATSQISQENKPSDNRVNGKSIGLQQGDDPISPFLAAICELHPRAWIRASDLWEAYERWIEFHQERFPLSRREFIASLKTHGCYPDRTSAARIWRGITLVKKRP